MMKELQVQLEASTSELARVESGNNKSTATLTQTENEISRLRSRESRKKLAVQSFLIYKVLTKRRQSLHSFLEEEQLEDSEDSDTESDQRDLQLENLRLRETVTKQRDQIRSLWREIDHKSQIQDQEVLLKSQKRKMRDALRKPRKIW